MFARRADRFLDGEAHTDRASRDVQSPETAGVRRGERVHQKVRIISRRRWVPQDTVPSLEMQGSLDHVLDQACNSWQAVFVGVCVCVCTFPEASDEDDKELQQLEDAKDQTRNSLTLGQSRDKCGAPAVLHRLQSEHCLAAVEHDNFCIGCPAMETTSQRNAHPDRTCCD